MSGVKFIIIGVAVAAAVGAVAVVQSELDRARMAGADVAPQVVDIERSRVLVTARSVTRGQGFRDGALEWREWPTELVSESFITEQMQPDALVAFESAIAKQPLAEGEPLKPEKLIMLDHPGVVSAMLRDGMRAFAIAIAQETGAGGFVLPSDYVDVIVTRDMEIYVCNPDGEFETRNFLQADTLLRTVRVLAVDTEIDAGEEANTDMERTTTLEVTPDQAVLLSLAERAGRLTLALRGIGELVGDNGAPRPELWPETVAGLDLAQEALTIAAAARGELPTGDNNYDGPVELPTDQQLALATAEDDSRTLTTAQSCGDASDRGPRVQMLRGTRLTDSVVQ